VTPADLSSRGLSTREAARLLGVADRTLRRILARVAAGELAPPWSASSLRRLLGPELPTDSPLRMRAERLRS
jgi:hypothetical protein